MQVGHVEGVKRATAVIGSLGCSFLLHEPSDVIAGCILMFGHCGLWARASDSRRGRRHALIRIVSHLPSMCQGKQTKPWDKCAPCTTICA
jgi:hypothetical protein